jgi:hypothetical protein
MLRPATAALLLAPVLALGPIASPLSTPQGGKKGPPPRLQTFVGPLEAALSSAFDRNVPVLLIAILETEDSDVLTLREEVLHNGELARASELTVVVLANNGVHPLKTVREEVDGAEVERELCSAYLTESCSDHQKPFDEIYNAYNVDGELRLPFVAVLTPDRERYRVFEDGSAPTVETVVKALEGAREKAGEGLTDQALREVRVMLARGAEQQEREAWGEVWRSSARVLELTQATRYADTARERQEACLAGFEAWRDAALAQLEAGEVLAGYQRLLDLAAATETTPLEKDVPKVLKQVERDARWKDQIAAYKRELEARALFDEAARYFREGNDKRATATLRKLLRKYEDTEAAAEAKKRWPLE